MTERSKRREVYDDLRDRIDAGDLAPDDSFPSEQDLMSRYGYSRDTIRKALGDLEHDGLITTPGQGRPRRVRKHEPLTVPFAQSETRARADQRRSAGRDAWMTDVRDLGREPGQQAIMVRIDDADAEVARRLGIKQGDAVLVRHHLRTVDGDPHNLSDTFYPMDVAGQIPQIMHPADVPQGVILLMREHGLEQDVFVYEFEARMPTRGEAEQLRIPQGVPVIVQYTTGRTGDGRPLKLTVTIWPADRARLIAELPG